VALQMLANGGEPAIGRETTGYESRHQPDRRAHSSRRLTKGSKVMKST
jgi:hypothetical protein